MPRLRSSVQSRVERVDGAKLVCFSTLIVNLILSQVAFYVQQRQVGKSRT